MDDVDVDPFDDVYGDLEAFDAGEKLKEYTEQIAKLTESLEAAKAKNKRVRADNQKLSADIKVLTANNASLLLTARNEIRRKDNEIQRLRKEKEDICFRRNKPPPKPLGIAHQTQTEITFGNQDTVDVFRRGQTTLVLDVEVHNAGQPSDQQRTVALPSNVHQYHHHNHRNDEPVQRAKHAADVSTEVRRPHATAEQTSRRPIHPELRPAEYRSVERPTFSSQQVHRHAQRNDTESSRLAGRNGDSEAQQRADSDRTCRDHSSKRQHTGAAGENHMSRMAKRSRLDGRSDDDKDRRQPHRARHQSERMRDLPRQEEEDTRGPSDVRPVCGSDQHQPEATQRSDGRTGRQTAHCQMTPAQAPEMPEKSETKLLNKLVDQIKRQTKSRFDQISVDVKIDAESNPKMSISADKPEPNTLKSMPIVQKSDTQTRQIATEPVKTDERNSVVQENLSKRFVNRPKDCTTIIEQPCDDIEFLSRTKKKSGQTSGGDVKDTLSLPSAVVADPLNDAQVSISTSARQTEQTADTCSVAPTVSPSNVASSRIVDTDTVTTTMAEHPPEVNPPSSSSSLQHQHTTDRHQSDSPPDGRKDGRRHRTHSHKSHKSGRRRSPEGNQTPDWWHVANDQGLNMTITKRTVDGAPRKSKSPNIQPDASTSSGGNRVPPLAAGASTTETEPVSEALQSVADKIVQIDTTTPIACQSPPPPPLPTQPPPSPIAAPPAKRSPSPPPLPTQPPPSPIAALPPPPPIESTAPVPSQPNSTTSSCSTSSSTPLQIADDPKMSSASATPSPPAVASRLSPSALSSPKQLPMSQMPAPKTPSPLTPSAPPPSSSPPPPQKLNEDQPLDVDADLDSMDVDYELNAITHNPQRQSADILSLFDALETPRKTAPELTFAPIADPGSLISVTEPRAPEPTTSPHRAKPQPTKTSLMTLQANGDNSSFNVLPSAATVSHQPLVAEPAPVKTKARLSDKSFLREMLSTEPPTHTSSEDDAEVSPIKRPSDHRYETEPSSPDMFADCQTNAVNNNNTELRDLSSLSVFCAPLVAAPTAPSGVARSADPAVRDLLETLARTPQHSVEMPAAGAPQSPGGQIGEDELLAREMRTLDDSAQPAEADELSTSAQKRRVHETSRMSYYVNDDDEENVVIVMTRKRRRRSKKDVST